jgi:hypothetical protein
MTYLKFMFESWQHYFGCLVLVIGAGYLLDSFMMSCERVITGIGRFLVVAAGWGRR